MLKGRFEYKNRSIKYEVVMEEVGYGFVIRVKTRLGKLSLFKLELDMDVAINGGTYENRLKKYSIRQEELIKKWKSMCNEQIKICAQVRIREEIDKDIETVNLNKTIDRNIKDFNNRKLGISKSPNTEDKSNNDIWFENHPDAKSRNCNGYTVNRISDNPPAPPKPPGTRLIRDGSHPKK